MEPALQASKLHKLLGDFELGPVDNLSIETGLVTAIVGNNGAGKSTFLKLLMNLVKPTQGEIRMLDGNVREEEHWKQYVAYLPQRLVGYDPFSGNQLKKLISHLYPNWDESLFHQMVELFQINLSKTSGELSPGMQQKLALTLMLPRNANIMILDEPTAYMDIPSKQMLSDLLVDWMENGERSLVLASHQTDEIRKLADIIITFKDGKITGQYEKDQLTRLFTQYWLAEPLPHDQLPGEVKRKGDRVIITDNEPELEDYLRQHHMKWLNKEKLDVDYAISLMLMK